MLRHHYSWLCSKTPLAFKIRTEILDLCAKLFIFDSWFFYTYCISLLDFFFIDLLRARWRWRTVAGELWDAHVRCRGWALHEKVLFLSGLYRKLFMLCLHTVCCLFSPCTLSHSPKTCILNQFVYLKKCRGESVCQCFCVINDELMTPLPQYKFLIFPIDC